MVFNFTSKLSKVVIIYSSVQVHRYFLTYYITFKYNLSLEVDGGIGWKP